MLEDRFQVAERRKVGVNRGNGHATVSRKVVKVTTPYKSAAGDERERDIEMEM